MVYVPVHLMLWKLVVRVENTVSLEFENLKKVHLLKFKKIKISWKFRIPVIRSGIEKNENFVKIFKIENKSKFIKIEISGDYFSVSRERYFCNSTRSRDCNLGELETGCTENTDQSAACTLPNCGWSEWAESGNCINCDRNVSPTGKIFFNSHFSSKY